MDPCWYSVGDGTFNMQIFQPEEIQTPEAMTIKLKSSKPEYIQESANPPTPSSSVKILIKVSGNIQK